MATRLKRRSTTRIGTTTTTLRRMPTIRTENEGNDYTECEVYEDPFPYEQETALYETEYGEPVAEEDPQLEEAYAAYLDARRQFANLEAARGYYPVVALAPDGDASPLQSPFPRPSKGGKGKGGSPRRKGGKGKGKGHKVPPTAVISWSEILPMWIYRAHVFGLPKSTFFNEIIYDTTPPRLRSTRLVAPVTWCEI